MTRLPSDSPGNAPQTDYLKTRTYLYKFTPLMRAGGLITPRLNKGALAKIESQRRLDDQTKGMVSKLKVIKDGLDSVNNLALASDLFNERQKVTQLFRDFLALPGVDAPNGQTKIGIAKSRSGENSPYKFQLTVDRLLDAKGQSQRAFEESISSGVELTLREEDKIAGSLVAAIRFDIISLKETTPGNKLDRQEKIFTDIDDLRKLIASHLSTIAKIQKGVQNTIKKLDDEFSEIRGEISQYLTRKFNYDLDVADLTRFDITSYLAGYSTSQNIGLAGSIGNLNWDTTFQNRIIPINQLERPGDGSVGDSTRRPIFFPLEMTGSGINEEVSYGQNTLTPLAQNGVTKDPVTQEAISTIGADILINRIAILQTMEDGNSTGAVKTKEVATSFEEDIIRIEIAMRIRGIYLPTKKEALLTFFQGDPINDDLLDIFLTKPAAVNRILGITTAATQIKSNPSLIKTSLKDALKGNLSAVQQLEILKAATDSKADGLLLSDLIQKFDYITTYVYKEKVAADFIESSLKEAPAFNGNATDPFFFDKETNLSYAPLNRINSGDSRKISPYYIDYSGFVVTKGSSEVPGQVNTLTITGGGTLTLFGASRRVFNPTIFEGSIFAAAEITGEQHFSVFQNLFQDKDPLEILEVLLDSTYTLRTRDTSGQKNSAEEKARLATLRTTVTRIINTQASRAFQHSNAKIDLSEELKQVAINKQLQIENRKFKNNPLKGRREFDKRDNLTSYLDILGLRAYNQFNELGEDGDFKGTRHMFNMSAFLFANVMRMRGINVRIPTAATVSSMDVPSKKFSPDSPNVKQSSVTTQIKKVSEEAGGSLLEVSKSIINNETGVDTDRLTTDFKAYFIFIAQSLDSYVPTLKTPAEIMNDISAGAYLEFYETPSGRLIFRTPQYNNTIPVFKQVKTPSETVAKKTSETDSTESTLAAATRNVETIGGENQVVDNRDLVSEANMITSEDIIPINIMYGETTQNLQSKLQLGYGIDLVGLPIDILRYHYTNGKMLTQFGLRMSSVDYNPNVRFKALGDKFIKAFDTTISSKILRQRFLAGVFSYAQFFLEYNNMQTLTGKITAVGDPRIRVGRTYFDVENHKFGYISNVSKSLRVGSTYTMELTLIGVRDAAYTGSKFTNEKSQRVTVRELPTMENLVRIFSTGKKGTTEVRMNQQDVTSPSIDSINPTEISISESPIGQSRGTVTGLPFSF